MNITAIICEYNPFHRGHILQLEEIRRAKGQATAIIALMSGSTVQRGQLSIYSKYARAEAAIKCGVNLVLELPCPYSCGSAEYFARGAISLLDSFCVIDSLCFGSESGDIVMLGNAAENIRKEGYISAVKTADSSESHQRSAEAIYRAMFGSEYPTSPNDILAVEYLAALKEKKSNIVPFTYCRMPGYTASGTRAAILSGEDASDMIPIEAHKIFSKLKPMDETIYSAAALYVIRNTSRDRLSEFYGMNGGVSGYLKNNAASAADLSELISLCTCRKYSSSRLRRACLAALLGIKSEDMKKPPLFANLLAADRLGREILSDMRKKSKVPVITKNADSHLLSPEAKKQYLLCRRADELFALSEREAPRKYICTPPYIKE